jgi:hypothetical protein
MSSYRNSEPVGVQVQASESLRLEAVTVCMGFDDMLDLTLGMNHPHLDTMIVVTSHEDRATQLVARKHGAICVLTDLHKKNGRSFNKGAAINAGLGHFQWNGWRLHLDADIALPDNFRRILFNHSALDPDCLYGADRVDVIGKKGLTALRNASLRMPQHMFTSGLSPVHGGAVYPDQPSSSSARFVDTLHGYCPIGFFQLWHAKTHKAYPYSLGTAAHDDVLFATQWPQAQRRLLPTAFVYHLCARPPYYGENWDGQRRQPRL